MGTGLTYQYGQESEKLAIKFLEKKGYKIIKNRYKTKFGEIDIIAEIENILVFVEVKARKSNELIEVILRKNQIDRIKNAAEFFIANHLQYEKHDVRFDFILLFSTNSLEHYEAYFE